MGKDHEPGRPRPMFICVDQPPSPFKSSLGDPAVTHVMGSYRPCYRPHTRDTRILPVEYRRA